MGSLYERLGGQGAVEQVVEGFYRRVLKDERVNAFFDDVDMDRQIAKQQAFLTMVFGGPARYSGLDMRTGHAHLVARGLNSGHVDAVIEILGATLADAGVGQEDIKEVARIANSVRDDVLGRRAT